MSRINGIRRLLHIAGTRKGIERAVDDELQFHFDMTVRDLMANGMSPEDARREAQRRFGDVESARERIAAIDRSRVGQERRAEWWSAAAQDFRYALRGLRLKPGFAIAVVATLGLGLGANATMFGIVDRLLFRPPDHLIAPERASRLYIALTNDGKERKDSFTGYRRYRDFRENTRSFDAMTPWYWNYLAVGAGEGTMERGVGVSGADLWTMFDVKPVIGRFFTEQEDLPPEGTHVTVISYAFWQSEFDGRANAIGSSIAIGPDKYTIIGVAPEGFTAFSAEPVVAFIPISAHSGGEFKGRQVPWYETYNMTWFEVIARRKPGVTLQQANADLTNVYQQSYRAGLAKNPRATPLEIAKPRAFAGPLLRDRGPNEGNDAKVATWLIGVSMIVLLIACANVANLLLARSLKRRREIAVRIALGVSRSRLLMQLFIESLVLATLGGFSGVAIAQWGGTIMRTQLLAETAAPAVATDSRVLVFVGLLSALTGLFTGLAPAIQAGRTDVAASLKSGSREGSMHRSRLRSGLLIAQAALSVVLLVGAGLFLRSLFNVRNVRLGYDADRVLWVTINSRSTKLDSAQQVALRRDLVAAAKRMPEVEHASRALTVPFWSTWNVDLYVAGIDSVNKLGDFTLQSSTAEFFETMGTRILRGRGIHDEDRANAPRVIVVGAAMAKTIWPNQDAIGKCIRVNSDSVPCSTVVGIAEDVRRGNLTKPDLHYYLSIDQFGSQGGLFVRTRGAADKHVERVRRELQRIMPGASYVSVLPVSKILGTETRSWKLGATMFAVFGALALVLAAIGLYSVIAYTVAQRTHEMGVRVAIGAQGGDVIRLIVREGLRVVLPGVALGAAFALAGGKWIGPLLFQVTPDDPTVMLSVVATLIVVAVVASWVPAMRASRVDPNEALRAD